ncbi:MAG: glycosyltransferase family 2 protein [Shewanella vesiculosa]|uniref:glycosyltransferase family 2 protein n=1 Tax=Shewanella vesiculosa TaxID=518738 RepID=UPI00091FC8CE|nr:glycosyltransferase family 2 protein [Shewanella vesiculosa]NCO14331.1 glycosyltransferase family 2 protein [Thiomicrospira sp.]NCP38807.1 glycosyltransferase family 2 protein [Shewanella vesiculosa]OIP96391.1 MAG: hypothetical protein AUK56_02210 [Thiomicrospira sp. CG2_30_44_34]
MLNKQVICVMVSFNPDIDGLLKSVESVLANNVQLILVDNGSANQNEIVKLVNNSENVVFCPLQENKGIAAAQNRGIEVALNDSVEFIWLSDQDTLYPIDFLDIMLHAFKSMSEEEQYKVAALAPSFYDHTLSLVQPVFRFSPYTKRSIPHKGLNESTHVIASGMLIPKVVFSRVGFKREDFFIDWVDTEWCWRSIYQYKLKIWVVGDVQIDHVLGDEFGVFLTKKFTLRTPFRHYFMVRNAVAIILFFKKLPLIPRLEILFKTMVRVLLFPIIAPCNKREHFIALWTGVFHGLFNKLGPKK